MVLINVSMDLGRKNIYVYGTRAILKRSIQNPKFSEAYSWGNVLWILLYIYSSSVKLESSLRLLLSPHWKTLDCKDPCGTRNRHMYKTLYRLVESHAQRKISGDSFCFLLWAAGNLFLQTSIIKYSLTHSSIFIKLLSHSDILWLYLIGLCFVRSNEYSLL